MLVSSMTLPDAGPPPPPGQPAQRAQPWREHVYDELHDIAAALMQGERPSHTLDPTELVHETWLRLCKSRNAASLERGEFLGLAAQAMRRILTDHARGRSRLRRGGGWQRAPLTGLAFEPETGNRLMDLEALLGELAEEDEQLVRIVELRFFAGASVEETAQALGLSPRTVKRRWRFGRAWLHRRLEEPGT